MDILNKQVLDCLKELQQLSSELIHTASMPDRTDLLNKIRVRLDFFRETFLEMNPILIENSLPGGRRRRDITALKGL